MTTGHEPESTEAERGQAPDTIAIELTLNRAPTRVEVDPSEPLAYTLRERLGLTGTKVSCDVQACGACTVLVDGLPRSSCTYLTYETAGRTVLTVEGLSPDRERLAALQEAFVAENGLQCGFCTPGMLLAAHAWLTLDADADADGEDLLEYMSGNICRCTGYLPIVAAILRARAG